jgi:hypothetical protein
LLLILSGLINFQKDLDEIKFSLRDVTTKDDLNEMTKDLVKTSDLENIVTGIVACLATCTVSENSFLIDVIWSVPFSSLHFQY